jgi:hypothetical protein
MSRMVQTTIVVAIAGLFAVTTASAQGSLGTAFIYQGQLKEDGEAVTDAGDFTFELWDAATGGQRLATDSIPSVPITDGLFAAEVDFGRDMFTGEPRWLQITVDLHHGGYATLSPRQPVSATPYALYAVNSGSGGGDCLWEAAGNDIYYQLGDVGVGTNNPGYPLHVISSSGDTAVAGENTSESTFGYLGHEVAGVYGEGSVAVRGQSTSQTGKALYGVASAIDGDNYGVYGQSASRAGYGVYGYASSTDGGIGVYGTATSPNGYGGYFDGRGYFRGNVGVGTTNPGSPLTVAGLVESTAGGFKFPDGTTQTTAATGGGDSFWQEAANGIYYPDGNVGFGLVTNPSHVIHATGSDPDAVINVTNNFDGPGGNAITAQNNGTDSAAVFGRNWATTAGSHGLSGISYSPDGSGARGRNLATSGDAVGVSGWTSSTEGIGVHGYAMADTGTTYGVYGQVDSPDGFGGYFDGMGYFSGKVGIGTNSPGSPLTVAGLVESTAGGFKFPDGTVQTTAAGGGGGDCLWSANGSNIYYDDGNVGVGTSNPLYPLHVTSDGMWTVHAHNTTASGNARALYGVADSNSGGYGVAGSANASSGEAYGVFGESFSPDGYAVFGRNEGEEGASHGVYGESWSPSGIGVHGYVSADAGHAASTGVYGEVDSTEGRGVYGHATATSGYTYGVLGETESGEGAAVMGRSNASAGHASGVYGWAESVGGKGVLGINNYGGHAVHGTASGGGFAGYFEGTGYFSGSVGIGVTSPAGELSVAGDADFSGNVGIGTSAPGNKLSVAGDADFSGKVGIGTTTPHFTLHVVGDPTLGSLLIAPDEPVSNASSEILLGEDDEFIAGMYIHYDGIDNRLEFGTQSPGGWRETHLSIIRDSGEVGIGTLEPEAELDVAGTVCMDGFKLNDTSHYGYVLTCDNWGNGTWQEAASGFDLPYEGTVSSDGPALKITNTSDDPNSCGAWFESSAQFGEGLRGVATGYYAAGVRAKASGDDAAALSAYATGLNGVAVFAKTDSPTAPTILARNTAGGPLIDARNSPSNTVFEVANDGTTTVGVLQISGGSDLAEKFDVTEPDVQPGMVVEIDPDNPGKLRLARGVYNRRVAGVISGANGVETGMLLADLPGAENSMPIALSGRAWVYCDATDQAIEPGDMLTTAERPGYAMPVLDHSQANGAVIGKAMSRLAQGETGMVLVLVNLQ